MPNRNPLSGRAGLHSITPLLYPKLHTISHRGRPYARYLDFTAPLLVALTTSPSRLLDCFATAWALSNPDEREQIARSALTPRFL